MASPAGVEEDRVPWSRVDLRDVPFQAKVARLLEEQNLKVFA